MDSRDSVPEDFCVSTCENLNNAHVYEFISRVGIPKTATELLSFERCPSGLNSFAFKYPLKVLKTRFTNLRKNSYRGGAEENDSFASAAYEYPAPASTPTPTNWPNVSQREASQLGDAETFAKVALEVAAELHEAKQTLEEVQQKSKRKIDALKAKVDEAKEDNRSLNDALREKNEDYKRLGCLCGG